jgi:hypothetical protein
MNDGSPEKARGLYPAATGNATKSSCPAWGGSVQSAPFARPMYGLNYFEEGVPMSRIFAAVVGMLMSVSQALANEPKGGAPDYSGISGIYYTLIGLILVYGVYDTFFKKS